MSTIIEEVLQLPWEEKLELLHALQEDLEHGNETQGQDDLSKDQWDEIFRREKMLESGDMKAVGADEF